ncbi:hypothetical protein [Amycolatopsis benzoatilytica]|uniref:hypothetical protein n=1 Tax=Amycolatopsis benzoatilytica TaxID=346045 RepID=UPI00039F2E56|nr:hypothetical protein [Amycolatopsis benzoatilytica]
MTDQTGGDQPQKTVAELLAQHGQQVDGGRRRRRRASDDEDEAPRRSGLTDTGPQAIIDRVAAEGGTPPPPSRPPGGGRRRPDPVPPRPPRPGQQDSGQYGAPQPSGQYPVNGPQDPGYVRPPAPPQDSGQYPVNGQQESGYVRAPQESGQYPRPGGPQDTGYQRPPAPPQESGQFARPAPPAAGPQGTGFLRPAAPQDTGYARPPAPQPSGQMPVPPQPSGQMPVPGRRPQPGEETRAQAQPVRRRPAPQPPAAPASGPGGQDSLSARLDGLDGVDGEAAEPPAAPMASGAFPAPGAAPGRPRRAPARRPAPKAEPSTQEFVPVDGQPEEGKPAGLAGWRQRRQQEQLEDTEVGVMPAVPAAAEPGPAGDYVDDGYEDDDYAEDGYEDEYPPQQPAAQYDAGPPTQGYPAPMPFAPGGKQAPAADDLSEYEREFAEPGGYPAGSPDFEGDDGYGYEHAEGYEHDGSYDQGDGYEQGDEYDDYPEEAVADEAPAAEEAPAASAGKQWLTLAGQLALGVVGGAGVWLGFNWLWVNLAPAALVGALLVIVALVWIVRKIRRAEDLQTTLLAILVGLVVTVSPAALLLVAK